MPARQFKRLIALLLVVLGSATVIVGYQWHLFDLASFQWQEWRNTAELRQGALWLPDYQVEIEARPIAGLENVSALTYHCRGRCCGAFH